MRTSHILGLMLFIFLVLGFIYISHPYRSPSTISENTSSLNNSISPSSSRTTATPTPIEYQLATLNKGGYVAQDDITVTRFRFLLDSLERKTTNTKQQIADTTFNAQKLARDKYGKEVTLLELMEGANRAIPEGSNEKMDYTDIISMVTMLYVN